MKVRYIGPAPTHRDRLFDTGLRWFQGQVHDVNDQTASTMVGKHPDVYEVVPDDAPAVMPLDPAPEPPEPPAAEDPPASPELTTPAPGAGENEQPEGAFDPDAITVVGAADVEVTIPLENASKGDMETFCEAHFGVDLDKRRSRDALADEVRALIAERGHPQAPKEPPASE